MNRVELILSIVFIVLGSLFCIAIITAGLEFRELDKTCQKLGWEELDRDKSIGQFNRFKCIKHIDSPTGLGREKIVSGWVKK